MLNKRKQNSSTWNEEIACRWWRPDAKAVGVESITQRAAEINWRRDEASAARGRLKRAERPRRVDAQIHKRPLQENVVGNFCRQAAHRRDEARRDEDQHLRARAHTLISAERNLLTSHTHARRRPRSRTRTHAVGHARDLAHHWPRARAAPTVRS